MTEGIWCKIQSAPKFAAFESPQSASLTAPLVPKGSLWCVRNFGLLQVTREKSRKTEGVFLVGSRRSGGKSKSLRARFLLPAFSFGEAKENADRQSQISNTGSYIVMCIIDYKNSTDLPRDFQLSPLPAATSQALRASSPFRGALGARLCQPRAPTYV